jgi:hypothetical protein
MQVLTLVPRTEAKERNNIKEGRKKKEICDRRNICINPCVLAALIIY